MKTKDNIKIRTKKKKRKLRRTPENIKMAK
jgi:hypothetical protein